MPSRAFLSPRISPVLVNLTRIILPFMLRTTYGGLKIAVADEDLDKLRRYRGRRMLLLPNHPTGEEPAVMFEVATRLNEIFNFVAARELFNCEHGFRGWVMRRLGVYSVIRGATDRDSFMMTRKILTGGKHRLVIFIEGEISRENDTLIPFETGVIQLAYWAQEGLMKGEAKAAKRRGRKKEVTRNLSEASAGRAARQEPGWEPPPVYMVPVAIKYFYEPGADAAIEQSLKNLEQALGLTPTPEMARYQRVQAIGDRVLTVQEALHQMISLPGTTLNERVEAIKNRMLKKMELFLDLRPDPEATAISRMRDVRNTIDRLVHSYHDPQDLSDYEKRMVEHFRLTLGEFYQDLDRVAHFLTYDEAYLRDNQTPEHFIEMLRRLEKEVFGDSRLTHPRTAVVKVGEVIDLKENYPAYEADKRAYVRTLAERLEADMKAMLSSIQPPPELKPRSAQLPNQDINPVSKSAPCTQKPQAKPGLF